MKQSPTWFDIYLIVNVKSLWEIVSNFVAFLENLNCKGRIGWSMNHWSTCHMVSRISYSKFRIFTKFRTNLSEHFSFDEKQQQTNREEADLLHMNIMNQNLLFSDIIKRQNIALLEAMLWLYLISLNDELWTVWFIIFMWRSAESKFLIARLARSDPRNSFV